MTTTAYTTTWGADQIEISADWADASSPVAGLNGGQQVADFRHQPVLAMRAALTECAIAEWLDADEREPLILESLAAMVEVEAEAEAEDEDEDEAEDGYEY